MNKLIHETLDDKYFPTSQFNNNTKKPNFIHLKEKLTLIKEHIKLLLPENKYRLTVNTGVGRLASCPWIGIHSDNDFFDSDPQSGLYLTLIWKEDGSGICLSFQKGAEFSQKKEILATVKRIKHKYGTLNFDEKIDLKSIKMRPKSYELANIYGKSYDINNLSSLKDHLLLLEKYYSKVVEGKTTSTIAIQQEQKEELEYQSSSPKKGKKTTSVNWLRNPKNRDAALKNANYQCEVDSSHKTFIINGKQFMEGHHIIPMEYQNIFLTDNLDVEENIVSICPNCHRKIHYSSIPDRLEMVRNIFSNRKKSLIQKINIDIQTLETFYDNI